MLLNNILLELKKGKIISYNDLAEKLDTDVSVVDAAIRQLCQMEYMQAEGSGNAACGGQCGGCSFAGSCGTAAGSGTRLWTITEKGNRYINSLFQAE